MGCASVLLSIFLGLLDGEFGVVGKLLVVTSDNGTLCAVDMSDKNPVSCP